MGTGAGGDKRVAALPTGRASSLAIGIAFAIVASVSGLSVLTSTQLVRTLDVANHTRYTIGKLNDLADAVSEMESARRAFSISGDESYLHRYGAVVARATAARAELEDLMATDSVQRERYRDIDHLLMQHGPELDDAITARRQHGFIAEAEAKSTRRGSDVRTHIRRVIEEMVHDENALLDERAKVVSHRVAHLRVIQVVGTCVGMFLLLAVFLRLHREVQRRKLSERRSTQAELKMSTILRSIGDAVIATDKVGRITRMNHAAEKLLGVDAKATLGHSFDDACDIADCRSNLPASITLSAADTGRHLVLIREDGSRVQISASATMLTQPDGQQTGLVYVLRDDTDEYTRKLELRDANERLVRLNEQLEARVDERTAAHLAANVRLLDEIDQHRKTVSALESTEVQLRQAQKLEAIGRLAGGIAHDFNNVLTVIIGASDSLLDQDRVMEATEIRTELEEIKKAGTRAADLTRQLLAFSRQQVLAPKVVDLHDIVTGMDKLITRLSGENIEMTTTSRGSLAHVRVDPGQVGQVLMNLVVNARDAMPHGGRITIGTENVIVPAEQLGGPSAGSYVVLSVADNGTGMTTETLSHMFEPFFTTKDVGKGTGLGLSTVFGVVEQSGGTIRVSSELGVGTTFRIYFPACEPGPIVAERAREESTGLATATILLVEDEETVRRIVRSMLIRAGYHVVEASNGVDALAASARMTMPIDLILTDLVMPRMGGPELVGRLSLLHPNATVVFMSGYTDDEAIQGGQLAPHSTFLQKPVSSPVLRETIRDLLRAKRVREL